MNDFLFQCFITRHLYYGFMLYAFCVFWKATIAIDQSILFLQNFAPIFFVPSKTVRPEEIILPKKKTF